MAVPDEFCRVSNTLEASVTKPCSGSATKSNNFSGSSGSGCLDVGLLVEGMLELVLILVLILVLVLPLVVVVVVLVLVVVLAEYE